MLTQRPFAKLLQRLKDFDADHSTVLMIQVENECGILGDYATKMV